MLVRKNNLECRRSFHRNRGRRWFGNSSVRCGRRRGHGDADWRSPRRGHRNQPRPQRQSLGCRQRSLLTSSWKRNSLCTRRSSRQTPTWAKSSVREPQFCEEKTQCTDVRRYRRARPLHEQNATRIQVLIRGP